MTLNNFYTLFFSFFNFDLCICMCICEREPQQPKSLCIRKKKFSIWTTSISNHVKSQTNKFLAIAFAFVSLLCVGRFLRISFHSANRIEVDCWINTVKVFSHIYVLAVSDFELYAPYSNRNIYYTIMSNVFKDDIRAYARFIQYTFFLTPLTIDKKHFIWQICQFMCFFFQIGISLRNSIQQLWTGEVSQFGLECKLRFSAELSYFQ